MDETTASGCASNPKRDRPINVGGERGVLWSYNCVASDYTIVHARDTYYLSAQTIHRRPNHRRVGYRFTVVVPKAKQASARPLLNRLLTGLTFETDSAAAGDQ